MPPVQINTEIVNITSLKPNPRNPRTATQEAMDRLKKQIYNLGQYKPIIVDTRTGLIVGGHMRYEALKQLGITNVFVSYITSENDAQAMEYALSDNDNIGITDRDTLAQILSELPDIRVDDYGVQFDEPENLGDFMEQFDTATDTDSTSSTPEEKKEECICPTCGNIHNKKTV